jgi:hypothetical protein
MSFINLPNVLLDVARNPVTALGIPLVVGTLSGLPTSRVVKGYWYQVCFNRILLEESKSEKERYRTFTFHPAAHLVGHSR